MDLPSADDRPIWDLWLSQYMLPVVLAADELGIFKLLRERPATVEDICAGLGLLRRSVQALVTALTAGGYLAHHQDQFQLTQLARNYLLPESPFYWVPMLGAAGWGRITADALMKNLLTENLGPDDRVTRRWERGEMNAEEAHASNQRMHSHSFPAALGLAATYDFPNVTRVLDVAGGSGCYSIALAMRHPHLSCTVADLPAVANDALAYIEQYGCRDRVDTYAFNMFDDPWPDGYDGVLMTNILHDWEPQHRAQLVQSSYAALPPNGRIFIHEVLLNDAHDGPLPAALFSVMMLSTRGKQLSFPELEDLLGNAGFVRIEVQPTYGYYSLVSGIREA